MALRSSIDLGTNTCLLLIADWDDEKKTVTRVIADYSTVVRLGQAVDSEKALHPEAMERTLTCLRDYCELLRKAKGDPAQTLCVATSQARDARNSAEFFSQIERETGFRFQVISGDDEARYTFVG